MRDDDTHRPHGEHPHLGKCDCDECQAWDERQTPITNIKSAPNWHPETVRSRLLCCVEYLHMHGLLPPGLYGALREDILCGRHEKQEEAK